MKRIIACLALACHAWVPGFCETPIKPRDAHRAFRNAYPIHVVPTMANSPGRFGAYFKTKVVIYNPTEFEYTIYATLYGPKGEVETRTIEMSPNRYWTWHNFLEQAFDYRGAGAVKFDSWFDPPGGSSDFDFSVYAEVYTESPNGRYSTVVTDGEGAEDINLGTSAIVDDGRFVVNAGVTSNANQRINVGVFNDEYSAKTYLVVVGDGQGNIAQTITLEVPGFGWAQKPVSARFENGVINWGCVQSYCDAYPWVVTVDNKSNDGSLAQPIVYDPPDE